MVKCWLHFIRDEKHFNLQSVKLTFLSKIWNMFKVNNENTRIRKVNDKDKNKDTIDVALASLLLILNTFDFLLQCYYCWLWSGNCRLGLLFVALTLCACQNLRNQFRQSFHSWTNYVNKLHRQNAWKHLRKTDIFTKLDIS